MVKRLPRMQEIQVQYLSQEDILEKEMATHSSILPGKSHEWRSLVGYSPWGRKESDTTERAHFTYILFQSVIAVKGEDHGTPLQYSCLENPIDGGDWQASFHGVAKSQTIEDPMEKGMTTHSSILACRIPWTKKPGRQSMGSPRVRHD